MLPDVLSVVVRTLSFVAALQAAGGALFLTLFGHLLSASIQAIARIVKAAALVGVVAFAVHYWLEAARMSGTLSGLFDLSLLGFLFTSATSGVLAVRLLGLVLVFMAFHLANERAPAAGIVGTVLLAASFALTGHTAASPERWLLAPALFLHLVVVTFWFGALLPLCIVSRQETPRIAAKVVRQFSRWAMWLVPIIFGAGLLMLLRLLPDAASLFTAYGGLLLGKIFGFALLMGLAALNKWRLGPALAADSRAAGEFRRSVLAEFALICIVLAMTAVMTTFFSPEA